MPEQPNILFLFSDEHSFRFMGHMAGAGGEPIATPTFDRLAGQGTVFTDTYCQMALCTPSRLCMLTGREAQRCGAWSNNSVLRPELPTLPGTLRDAGYATCLMGKMHLGGSQQFVGFQERPYGDVTGRIGHQWEPVPAYDNSMRGRTTTAVGVTGIPESLLQEQVICQESLAWLREQRHRASQQPWFLCASYSRPHFPLTAPRRHLARFWPDGVTPPKIGKSGDAWDHPMSAGMRAGFHTDEIADDEMMFARASYFACVSYLDELLGDFLVRLEQDGLLENTIIVYSSDHGEMAGEHGTWWKNAWYEASTRVPMIVSLPEQRRGDMPAHRCETPAALIDLFPTLTGLAGVEQPGGLDGADLSAVVGEQAAAPERPVVSDALTPRWGAGTEYRMVRRGRYKVVRFRAAPPLAFDLVADPDEQHDLLRAETPPAAVQELLAYAESSLDFDAAERDRTERDAGLHTQYALDVPRVLGNCYVMPSGAVVDAEDALYKPTVVADSLAAAFGPDWAEQNKTDMRAESP
jgi:choline-sulfatase